MTSKELMQAMASYLLQEFATLAIEELITRGECVILKKIDGIIPIKCFEDERIDRLSSEDRVKFIEGLYDDCDVYEQRDIANYTCGMASNERLRESIDWREEMERYKEEQESYAMERTLSAPQI